ncbi:MAG: nicotinate-nucleotide--dimethylbenzimidazole phosphoribosyltransferase [Gammaproteobacteria bacterium]|nr:nicotinate-nucleotide--dimethylbenzimidazole phosphoribosyltransferase [Gammaproteobacteria bacterium]MBU1959602.1 nicotinate-nucleotide--dimethylbenzimidazole phosphoribosyltransferase [Gammaproteobacteria bacterium]
MGEAARGAGPIGRAARTLGAEFEVVNLGTAGDVGPVAGVTNCYLGPGAANLAHSPSMTEYQIARALAAGRHAAERARLGGARLFIGQALGLGNTLAATALASALLDRDPESLLGPGDPVLRGIGAVRRGLGLHGGNLGSAYEALRRLGGFDLAALTGACLACAHMGLPVRVDGYLSAVAALAAARLCPGSRDWMRFSRTAAGMGHRLVIEALGLRPFSPDLGTGQCRLGSLSISMR